jgi:ferritin-like protein
VATYCAVREYDKIYYVAFGKERGGYITYRIEQTVP